MRLNLPTVNQSRPKSTSFKSYYDAKTRKIIEKRHFKDLDLFGYSF